VTALITAAAGFLIAVLWFDLMFDIQVLRHRGSPYVGEPVLDSISAYYRRVTTTASPMGRLVALVMLLLLAVLAMQAARGDTSFGVSAASVSAAAVAIGLAGLRVLGRARRLGDRLDPVGVRSDLARSIFRDHVVCLAAMVALLTIQVAVA
jgi:hypothetical protein